MEGSNEPEPGSRAPACSGAEDEHGNDEGTDEAEAEGERPCPEARHHDLQDHDRHTDPRGACFHATYDRELIRAGQAARHHEEEESREPT